MKKVMKINDLVIGGNLKALEYAFHEGLPVFYEKLEVPFHLEKTKEGINKKDILENYAFMLSMAGLNLHTHLVGEFRLEKNVLKIFGKKPWAMEIQFQNIHDFRTDSKKRNIKYKVVDYINVRSCGDHDIRELKTEEDFAKEIYFYPSKRANSSKNFSLSTHNYEKVVKDAIVVSYLTKKQIEEEDYSTIYSRLRLKEIMEEIGIVGKRRGTRPNGKIIRSSIVLEFDRREVVEIEQEKRDYYYTNSKNKYLQRMFEYMYGRNSKTKKN